MLPMTTPRNAQVLSQTPVFLGWLKPNGFKGVPLILTSPSEMLHIMLSALKHRFLAPHHKRQ